MDHPSGSIEDSGTEGDLNCRDPVQRFQMRRILISGLEIILVIFW